MSYKILRVKNFGFNIDVTHFNFDYSKNYEENLALIEDQKFIYCDGFKREMTELGNECIEIISKNEFLQKKWAKENKFIFSDKKWHDEILLQQINRFKPNVIYFEDCLVFDYFKCQDLKKKFNFLKLVIIRNGNPTNLIDINGVDLLLTISEQLTNFFKNKNLECYTIYHYFDDTILSKLKIKKKKSVSFLGESGYLKGSNYIERYRVLKNLLKKNDLKFYLLENRQRTVFQTIKHKTKMDIKKLYKHLFSKFFKFEKNFIYPVLSIADHFLTLDSLKSLYPHKVLDPVFGTKYFEVLNELNLLINFHRKDVFAGNLRLFEGSGVGVAQATNYCEEVSKLFKKNDEILFYKNFNELQDYINQAEKNPSIFNEIGDNSQKRVLKSHTTKIRLAEINSIIKKKI